MALHDASVNDGTVATRSAVMNTQRAAEYIGVSVPWLEKARLIGGGPIFVKIGRSVRYRASDLDEFLESGARRSTSAA